jgi:hypothetical protein
MSGSLVSLVYLVYLVHLVGFVQPHTPDRPDRQAIKHLGFASQSEVNSHRQGLG